MSSAQYIIEGIILRRLHEKRIEGYTIEMAKEIAEAVIPTHAQAAGNKDLLELAKDLEAAYRHQLNCAPAQLQQAHSRVGDVLFGHIEPIISSLRAAAYLASQPPAAPVETGPMVCDKCNEVMAAAVGLPVSDAQSSAETSGQEG